MLVWTKYRYKPEIFLLVEKFLLTSLYMVFSVLLIVKIDFIMILVRKFVTKKKLFCESV